MRFPRLEIVLTPSDEITRLREQVKQLAGERDNLQQEYNRIELLYRSECVINLELQDLLKEHGISFREVLKSYNASKS